MVLTEKAANVLRTNGWNEPYRGDIELYRSLYAEYGCPLPPLVEEFLGKYGGLHIRHRKALTQEQRGLLERYKQQYDNYSVPDHIEIEFNFDLDFKGKMDYIRRRGIRNCTDFAELAKRAGVKGMWRIGTYDNLSYGLVMSETGSVFACADETLLFVADTGEEAIDILLTTTDFPEIPE